MFKKIFFMFFGDLGQDVCYNSPLFFFLEGNCVSVGITSLTLKALLKDSNNNQVGGLGGNTTIPFSNCWANYTDLTLHRTGERTTLDPHTFPQEIGVYLL